MTNDTPVDVSVDELKAQRLLDKKEIEELKETVLQLTKVAADANALIEGDLKAKLIAELNLTTDYKLEELVNMSVDELKTAREVTKRVTPERKLTAGVDMSKIAEDKDAWKSDLYGKYQGMKK